VQTCALPLTDIRVQHYAGWLSFIRSGIVAGNDTKTGTEGGDEESETKLAQGVQAFTPALACQPDGRKTCTKPCVEQDSTRGSLPDDGHKVKLQKASHT
jgi:hypothetical protein